MIDKGPKMIKSDYSKQGQVKLSLKDSRLMLELGQKVGAPLLMTSVYSQIMQVALEKGYSEKDTVAFYEILRGMAIASMIAIFSGLFSNIPMESLAIDP